jgi:hypothetical protein
MRIFLTVEQATKAQQSNLKSQNNLEEKYACSKMNVR